MGGAFTVRIVTNNAIGFIMSGAIRDSISKNTSINDFGFSRLV
jgi:hypothetical protein